MAPATPLGERCIENWAEALHSGAVSCMLPVGPESKMEIPANFVLVPDSASWSVGPLTLLGRYR